MNFEHVSVLLNECIEGLNIKSDGVYVDCTLGGGGHSSQIVKRLSDKGMLIGIVQDSNAIAAASERLKDYTNVKYVHDNFSNIENIIESLDLGQESVDGFLLDLGVSSHQLDEAERGFSYNHDAPLDMRMDIRSPLSAYKVVNEYSMDELNRIIREYGEERWAKRIAQFIVQEREIKPIETTFELVSVIKKAVPKGARADGPHPAKRTFQAIRIEVNNEIKPLYNTARKCIELLKNEGRLCIITFHSLEDRAVKNAYVDAQGKCTCPKDLPYCVCGAKSEGKIINKKPIIATEEEQEENSRSKSAKLRIFEKIIK